MKRLLALSFLFSFSAMANSNLEAQKARIQSIINKNQQDINTAISILRKDQDKLRTSINANPILQDIQSRCADVEFERLIQNVKRNWEYDFVKMTTSRLESSYETYRRNPELNGNLKISQSEVFDLAPKVSLARSIKICNYNELFIFDESEDFKYAKQGAWQNYNAVLSFDDIDKGNYNKVLGHIVDRSPIKVIGNITRLGSVGASYRFGKVNLTINYDKVFSAGYRFNHPELTNPIEIIKKAKRL